MTKFITLAMLAFLTACGPRIDSRFTNRQIAYVEILPAEGRTIDDLDAFKPILQQELVSRLAGRGTPPAIGMTVYINSIRGTGDQNMFTSVVGAGNWQIKIDGKVQLWDAQTRAPLAHFLFSKQQSAKQTSLGGMIFKGQTEYPKGADQYPLLAKACADEIVKVFYGAN